MASATFWDDLLEIQSLDNLMAQAAQQITQAQDRLTALHQQKANQQATLTAAREELAQIKSALAMAEQQLAELTQRQTTLQNNLTKITTTAQLTAAETELAALPAKISAAEEQLLTLMQSQETCENTIAASTNFLQGVEKSQAMIQQEVAQEVAACQNQIAGWQARCTQLLAQLPSNLQHVFKPVYDRFRYKQPISFLHDQHCAYCHYTLASEEVAIINKGESAELCLNCGRLLAPESSQPSLH